MSQQEKGQGEPSMEEILASIRRIISDDDKDEEPAAEEAAAPAAEAEAVAPSAETPAPSPSPSVTPEKPVAAAEQPSAASPADVGEAPAPIETAPVADEVIQAVDTPPVEGAEELELTEVIEEDSPAPAPEKPVAAAPKPAAASVAKPNEALAEEGRKAFLKEAPGVPAVVSGDSGESDFIGLVSPPIREISTNTLAQLAEAIHARGFVLGNVSMTLEDLIRDLMRPHLKDWLDKNLPGIVERMVRAEIERMASEAEARKDLI